MTPTPASHQEEALADTAPADETVVDSPGREILREIARGGLTGVIVGAVVVGFGGRIAMRVSTMLQPGAIGGITDNGNRIGDITAGGTLALVTVGMFIGAMAGIVWVVATPWLPAGGWRRAIVAVPLAMAVGTVGLIEGNTGDFIQLHHDPKIVALLIALVGCVGLAFSLIDDLLERRLPHASARAGATALYSLVVAIGAFVVFPITLASYFGSSRAGVGLIAIALVVVGLATATWWLLRVDGHVHVHPPRTLAIVGRAALLLGALAGIGAGLPGVAGALGR